MIIKPKGWSSYGEISGKIRKQKLMMDMWVEVEARRAFGHFQSLKRDHMGGICSSSKTAWLPMCAVETTELSAAQLNQNSKNSSHQMDWEAVAITSVGSVCI